jgi:hypothetical protein
MLSALFIWCLLLENKFLKEKLAEHQNSFGRDNEHTHPALTFNVERNSKRLWSQGKVF